MSEIRICRVCGESKAATEFPSADKSQARNCGACLDAKDRERFWGKVHKGGPVPEHCSELGRCWEWTACTQYGYGQFGLSRPRRLELTHRYSWELANGPAGEMCVLHKCDNRRCVNPAHLFLGTRTDNMADKVRKGRQSRGENAGTVLTAETVRQIREWRARGISRYRIAKMLALSQGTIAAVIQGRTWKHVG